MVSALSRSSRVERILKTIQLTESQLRWDFSGGPGPGLPALSAGAPNSTPGQGTKTRKLQLEFPLASMKIKDPMCHS